MQPEKQLLILHQKQMQRLSESMLERLLFGMLLLLALAPAWFSGRFFVTGDGPCHVYNSRVLLDFILGQHRAFYDPFYYLNTNFDPNWLSHICLAGLQGIFAPEIAEKLFLSGYVLLFAFGLRFLLRQINPASLFLSSVGLLFVWHHLLQAGFYNYALSIALFFWVCGYWMRHRHAWTPGTMLVMAALWVLLYSAHPLGLIFSMAFIGSGLFAETLQTLRQHGARQTWVQLRGPVFRLMLAATPMLVLLIAYFLRKPWGADPNTSTVAGLAADFFQVKTLITLNSTERDIAKFAGALVGLLLARAIWQRRSTRVSADFILLFTVFVLWQYFRQAGNGALEQALPERIQPFIWLGLLCWTATAQFPKFIHWLAPALAAVLLGAFLSVRLPILQKAAALVEDYVNATQHIDDESVILVLNYDFGGLDFDGRPIANRNALFMHAADYIGAYRAAIMSDNYEATRAYFPMIWHWQRNMFGQTDKESINFENRPPRADILSFDWRSEGHKIDYVLLLSYDQRFYDHQYSREIMGQLETAYRFVSGSPRGKAEIWKRKE